MLDCFFHIAEDASSFFVVVIVLYVLHGRAGEHSFGSFHDAASRANIYRADGAGRSIQKSDDPDRLAALVCTQRVIGSRKLRMRRFRCVAGHSEGAAGIQVQPRNVNRCAFGRTSRRAIWSVIGINSSLSNAHFAHTLPLRVFQNNSPCLGLRIAFHASNRHNVIESAATKLRAHYAQSFVRTGVLLSPNLRGAQ